MSVMKRIIVHPYFIINLLILFYGCGQNTSQHKPKVIEIEVDSIIDVGISNFAKKIKIFDISSIKTSCNNIDAAYGVEDNLLVIDRPEFNVYLLDNYGNAQQFIYNKIDLATNKEDVFNMKSRSVSVDDNNKEIICWDGGLNYFSFTGEYLNRLAFPEQIVDCIGTMILNNGHTLSIVDIEKEDRGLYPSLKDTRYYLLYDDRVSEAKKISDASSTIFYNICNLADSYSIHLSSCSDTVFNISKRDGSCSTKYVFDFGVKAYPHSFASLDCNEQQEFMYSHPELAGGIEHYYESKDYLLLSFCYDNRRNMFVWNKTNNKKCVCNIVDDIFRSLSVRFVGQSEKSLFVQLNDVNYSSFESKLEKMVPIDLMKKLNDNNTHNLIVELIH